MRYIHFDSTHQQIRVDKVTENRFIYILIRCLIHMYIRIPPDVTKNCYFIYVYTVNKDLILMSNKKLPCKYKGVILYV